MTWESIRLFLYRECNFIWGDTLSFLCSLVPQLMNLISSQREISCMSNFYCRWVYLGKSMIFEALNFHFHFRISQLFSKSQVVERVRTCSCEDNRIWKVVQERLWIPLAEYRSENGREPGSILCQEVSESVLQFKHWVVNSILTWKLINKSTAIIQRRGLWVWGGKIFQKIWKYFKNI